MRDREIKNSSDKIKIDNKSDNSGNKKKIFDKKGKNRESQRVRMM